MATWKNATELDGSDISSWTAVRSDGDGRLVVGRIASIEHDWHPDNETIDTSITVRTEEEGWTGVTLRMNGKRLPLALAAEDLPRGLA